jgi:putative lipoic acid-binding regulatory protein
VREKHITRALKKNYHAIPFPCEFPLKVMGLNTETFQSSIKTIIRKHVNADEIAYSTQLSSGDKYISITATFTAHGKEQLDALYRELNDHELVLMTL